MYADDHQIYFNGTSIETVAFSLKKETENVSQWYKDNLLQANPNKYQILVIAPQRGDNNATDTCTLKIDDQQIRSTKNLKILGINMDDELSFSDHISDICKKASQKVGVLTRLRNLISCETKLYLYLTAILPNLTYCHTVWHFCKVSDRSKLERVQERALRVIFNSKTDTYDVLLSRAKLPSLYNRRLQDIAILMFKVKNGLAPDYIMELFRNSNKGYSLRNAEFESASVLFSSLRKTLHEISWPLPLVQIERC